MSEPTVQVPVSLIEQAQQAVASGDRGVAVDVVIALAALSQPTPTAETFRPAPDGWFTFGSHVGFDGPLEFSDEKDEAGDPLWERHIAASHAEPPRIEDMAPGTRFRFLHPEDGWRYVLANGKRIMLPSTDGAEYDRRYIDPSTIRDVTPPKDSDANA